MSKAKAQSRAVIHKNIIDTAEENPKASIKELSTHITGATPTLVERVLNEYGDPGVSPSEDQSDETETAGSNDDNPPPLNELTDAKREILAMIHEQPSATQRELGEQLGVSGATICSHVNSIDGFEWTKRKAFVEEVITNDGNMVEDGDHSELQMKQRKEGHPQIATVQESDDENNAIDTSPDSEEEIKLLRSRLTEIENKLENVGEDSDSIPLSPTLIHKVMHACLKSDIISDEEEITLLKEFI
jgi:hypothetical protein